MPKPVTWRDGWSLGIPALDREHRALLAHFNQIAVRYSPRVSARQEGVEPALICALTDLGEAVRAHFLRMTELMSAIGYEGVDQYHSESAQLIAEYSELLHSWRDDGLEVMDADAHQLVLEWLLAHILVVDREFVDAFVRFADRSGPVNLGQAAAFLRV